MEKALAGKQGNGRYGLLYGFSGLGIDRLKGCRDAGAGADGGNCQKRRGQDQKYRSRVGKRISHPFNSIKPSGK